MAKLEHQISKEQIILLAAHVFGRNPITANTIIEARDVSQIHASLRWQDNKWYLCDHSRNGTWINGKLLGKENVAELKIGDTIRFDRSESSVWTFIEDSVPAQNALVPLKKSGEFIELSSVHGLPNDQQPSVSVYTNNIGEWVLENEEQVKILNDGDVIELGNLAWRFISANIFTSTLEFSAPELGNFIFEFNVSLDQEHVELKLHYNDEEIDLGERVHHYLLLVLARMRLADHDKGVDTANQGWVDFELLSRMTGLDESYLNIQIFRIRNQLAKALTHTQNVADIIERRRGVVRIGVAKFRIFQGNKLEGTVSATLN